MYRDYAIAHSVDVSLVLPWLEMLALVLSYIHTICHEILASENIYIANFTSGAY